jgi:AraC-like DNA-binding protein
MHHQYNKPHKLLSRYVKTILTVEGAQPNENKLPLFTNGMPALLCHTLKTPIGTEDILLLTLFGKSTPPDIWEMKKNETMVAYFFNPFSLPCLFNLSATEIARDPKELSKWNAHKTNAVKTQLCYASTTAEKIEVLDSLLLHQLEEQQRECEIILYTTDQIMLNPGKEILSVILEELNLNERTFQRMFKKYVGITLGQYRRICQFKSSFDQVRNKQFDKLSDVGFNAGFADQSHFIRSFKEFTEITPKDYTKSGLKKK